MKFERFNECFPNLAVRNFLSLRQYDPRARTPYL